MAAKKSAESAEQPEPEEPEPENPPAEDRLAELVEEQKKSQEAYTE